MDSALSWCRTLHASAKPILYPMRNSINGPGKTITWSLLRPGLSQNAILKLISTGMNLSQPQTIPEKNKTLASWHEIDWLNWFSTNFSLSFPFFCSLASPTWGKFEPLQPYCCWLWLVVPLEIWHGRRPGQKHNGHLRAREASSTDCGRTGVLLPGRPLEAPCSSLTVHVYWKPRSQQCSLANTQQQIKMTCCHLGWAKSMRSQSLSIFFVSLWKFIWFVWF